MAVLGIDVGGHAIKAGIVDKKGKILKEETVLTEAEKGRDAVVENIEKMAKGLLQQDKKISRIGIGIPGIVNTKGFVQYTPNVPLSGFDLGKELKKRLKKSLFFGNDAKNFVLAQYNFGEGKGYNTVIGLTLGTGVGSGIVVGGKLFYNEGAPEFGHTTIKFDGPVSKCCGNNGCLESFLGRKTFPEGPLETYKKALAGDVVAKQHFKNFGTYLGVGIANFINVFNPSVVILGGELSNAFSFFQQTMEEEIKKRSLFKKTKILKSQMKYAGTIGAAILAF